MRKFLSVSFMILLVSTLALAQRAVNEERYAEAKENGKVVFESVLKNASMVMSQPASLYADQTRTWILKFENGATMRIEERGDSNELANLWWIDKKYVVYRYPAKAKKKTKAKRFFMCVELLEKGCDLE